VLPHTDKAVIAPDGLKGKRNSAGIAQSRILFRREPRIVLVSEAVSDNRTDQQCCNRKYREYEDQPGSRQDSSGRRRR